MNSAPDPHTAPVNPIVAAAGDDIRRALVDLARDARLDVRAVARDPAALADLLRPMRNAWVITGGTMPSLRPFLRAARSARSPAVALLSGPVEPDERSGLAYGGLAVLQAAAPHERLLAAAAASRAGLFVWDPERDSPETPVEFIHTPLSARERTMLELTGAGLSTKAIARRLGISPNTVKFHLQSAFEKLGVASRAEAVMTAIRRGEIAV